MRSLCAAVFLAGTGIAAHADPNPERKIIICNEGNIDLTFITFGISYTFMRDHLGLFGYFNLNVGDCANVNVAKMQNFAVAFTHRGSDGALYNPVFDRLPARNDSASRFGDREWSPEQICVTPGGIVMKVWGDKDQYIRRYTGPCGDDLLPLDVSYAGAFRRTDRIATVTIKPFRGMEMRKVE